MRLLYLTDRLSDRGGADHHLAQVISASVEAGNRVTVGFGRDEGSLPAPDGVVCRRFRGLSSMVDSSSRIGDLAEYVAAADVVHVQNIMNPTVLAMAVESGRAVVTVQDHRVFCPGQGKTMNDGSVCTERMADSVCRACIPDGAYRRSTLDLTRRRAAAVRGAELVVLSSYMAGELAAVGLGGARVIPPWVDVGSEKMDPGSTFVLAGRLVAHKGIEGGWRAWVAADRPLPMVVTGSGPLEAELHGCHRLGWLKSDELRAELRKARALIFPTRWQEPFGILGLEALAQGTPVVIAGSGGTGDWSATGCIRVSAGDVDGMAAAIGSLASEPELALTLGRAGRAAVAARFNRSRIVPKLNDVYDRVASS